jgi:hypothetical protein
MTQIFQAGMSTFVVRDSSQSNRSGSKRQQLLEICSGKIVRRYQSAHLSVDDVFRFFNGEIGVLKTISKVDECPEILL